MVFVIGLIATCSVAFRQSKYIVCALTLFLFSYLFSPLCSCSSDSRAREARCGSICCRMSRRRLIISVTARFVKISKFVSQIDTSRLDPVLLQSMHFLNPVDVIDLTFICIFVYLLWNNRSNLSTSVPKISSTATPS